MITSPIPQTKPPMKPSSKPSKSKRSEHLLHLEVDENNVAILTFDRPNSAANIFDEAALDELDLALRTLESLSPAAVVFTSAKPSIFIAGADLDSLASANEAELERLITKGQNTFQRIATLPMPTVAAIHGACLGGGLELALTCDFRVASKDSKTRIGLPETLLGILPAWGGSTRLPRLVGLPTALSLILSGKALTAFNAKKLGVVDFIAPKERLLDAAMILVKSPPRKAPRFFTHTWPIAAFIGGLTKARVLKKTRGNYPAQELAIEVVSKATRGSVADSLERELAAVSALAKTPEAANLLRVFRLQERSKKARFDASVDPKQLPKIERTAVIGAGVMGSGIAQWFAAKNLLVILRDIDRERVAAGMKSINKLFHSAVKKRILTQHEATRKLDLVAPSAEPISLAHCDLVVEAAVENLDVKKKIFADLCSRTRPDTILATNTSALPISELCTAEGVTHPERLIGLHFFNPVSRMKLVEVVITEHTSPETVERTLAFVRKIGKLPVVVQDSPGFLVNRILMPYLIEAGRLVDTGVSPEQIDTAMLDFGMPMGPIRLLDEIGLDVAAHVAVTMREAFGDRFELPRVLNHLVKEDRLGRKSGSGFYHYNKGKTVVADEFAETSRDWSSQDIAHRLAQLMADEANRCLEEGVASDADDIDFAMIMGTGFAPFRGGPLTWSETTNSH